MLRWRSFFEIAKTPLEVLAVAFLMLGIGNLLTNGVFGIVYVIDYDITYSLAQAFYRIGQFLIVNFPLLFLIRFSMRKNGGATSVISAIAGYVSYQVVTMIFAPSSMPTYAYSSILGLSMLDSMGNSKYPLQTGAIAAILVGISVLFSWNTAGKRQEGRLSPFQKEVTVLLLTILFSMLSGILVAIVWPYFISFVEWCIQFISGDTGNPVRMMIYGMLDRIFNVFHLGTLIRSPFWYGNSGGSWVNVSGSTITGDVNIWTAQITAGTLVSGSGKFITPYYILNIFAFPGMILSMHSLNADKTRARKTLPLVVLAVIASVVLGTSLPFEFMILILAPLLFAFHVVYTGALYAVMTLTHAYLGFSSTDSITIAALPGSLPELFAYTGISTLRDTMLVIVIAGVITFIIYFFVTRLYFKYLALDLFKSGKKRDMTEKTITAVGGVENIRAVSASVTVLNIDVYDPVKMDFSALKPTGYWRILQSHDRCQIFYGASSIIIAHGLNQRIHESIRDVNEA